MNENNAAVEEFANNILTGLVNSIGYTTVFTQLAKAARDDAVHAEAEGQNTPEYQNRCDAISDKLEEAATLARTDSEDLASRLLDI